MPVFTRTFPLSTREHNATVDISEQIRSIVAESGVRDGVCTVFTRRATAAITINENDDPNVGVDFLSALRKLVIEHAGWLHDRVDNNAAGRPKPGAAGTASTRRHRRQGRPGEGRVARSVPAAERVHETCGRWDKAARFSTGTEPRSRVCRSLLPDLGGERGEDVFGGWRRGVGPSESYPCDTQRPGGGAVLLTLSF
jgi:secondary thiamine-phosphate synthase enzyme